MLELRLALCARAVYFMNVVLVMIILMPIMLERTIINPYMPRRLYKGLRIITYLLTLNIIFYEIFCNESLIRSNVIADDTLHSHYV